MAYCLTNKCPSSNITAWPTNQNPDVESNFEDSVFDTIIWTPYYRTIPNVTISGCAEEADFNYTSYDIFALDSRLIYWLNHNFESGLSVKYPSRLRNSKFYIIIEVTK